MSIEERPRGLVEEDELEEIEEIEEEPGTVSGDFISRRHQKLQQKNINAINSFLGKGRKYTGVFIMPRYYGELLTWSLHRLLAKEGWQVFKTLGYKSSEPVFIDVFTALDKCENLLMNGQMLTCKDSCRFIATIGINPRWRSSVQIEGPLSKKELINSFIDAMNRIAREQNFYRGKKISYDGRIHFLDLRSRYWDSVVLDENTKKDIKANTIDFQKKIRRWAEFGIPPKRGVLLAGEPGTGKTAICKALMAEAEGITCIAANPADLSADGYISELYDIAQDLAPSMVFVEDIDQIGQDRSDFPYSGGPALPSLLSILDGIEEKREIVTVATTNFLKKLDKALSQRPSRFDRIVIIPLPSLEHRKELVNLLCRKIPLDEATQSHIALRTNRCTPAQIQEIVYSMVIERDVLPSPDTETCLSFSSEEVENVIRKIKDRNERHMGFCMSATMNGNGLHGVDNDKTGITK